MRLLLTLAAAAALAACSKQSENNAGQSPPPETGRVSPADTARNLPPPAPAPIDTATKTKPDTSIGGGGYKADTTMAPAAPTTRDTSSTMKHDSM